MINSVVSFSLYCGTDPIKAVERAKKFGHNLHFINALGASFSDKNPLKEKYIEVCVGDKVWFEGRKFRIIAEANNNLGLEEIE